MKQYIFVVFFSIFSLLTYGQDVWNDDFSDGNLYKLKKWEGDTLHFDCSGKNLQQNDTAKTGSSLLFTTSSAAFNGQWHFKCHLDFNPSSSNFTKIYFIADQPQPQEGYFIQMGGQTSDLLQLGITRKGKDSTLISSSAGYLNNSQNTLNLSISRDSSHHWTLIALDQMGTTDTIGFTQFPDTPRSNYFVIQNTYTSTRYNKFSFDDFSVTGASYQDTIAPQLIKHQFNTKRELVFHFSEPLDTNNATFSFNASPPKLKWLNQKKVEIQFPTNLKNLDVLPISFSLFDIAGNENTQQIELVFDPLTKGDLFISEIMPDPEPQVDSIACEYIEIYANRKIETDTLLLMIQDKSPIQLFANLDSNRFYTFGNCMLPMPLSGDANLPSLINDGGQVTLMNKFGDLIDRLNYEKGWHTELKKNGGWSLEKRDLFHCNISTNWRSSTSASGGSPGKPNTLLPSNKKIAPTLLGISHSPPFYFFDFNFPIEPKQVHFYGKTPNDQSDSVFTSHENGNQLGVRFSISNPSVDSLKIEGCLNTTLFIPYFQLQPIQTPLPGDIVVSEILFNPKTNCPEFIEFKNTSNKILSWSDLYFGQSSDGKITALAPLSPVPQLIFPNTLFTASTDVATLKSFYEIGPRHGFSMRVNSFNLPQTGSTILITNPMLDTLLYFSYDGSEYNGFLEDPSGISLENFGLLKKPNWVTAAYQKHNATPGFENTHSSNRIAEKSWISFSGDLISPNGDLKNDQLIINFNLDTPTQIRILLFHFSGLSRGQLFEGIERNGQWIWNGETPEGTLEPGTYILFIEAITENGEVKKRKHAIRFSRH